MFSISLKSISQRLVVLILAFAGFALGQAKAPSGVLPQAFSGWRLEPQSVKITSDAAAADPTDSPVLKEYGFADLESAAYTRNGRTMQVKAARFNDATGAFGAF